MTDADRAELLARFSTDGRKHPWFAKAEFSLLSGLNAAELAFLQEESLLPSDHKVGPSSAGFFFPERSAAVLVNGTEHLTIVVNGSELKQVLSTAGRLDDFLLSRFDIAFSDRFGFLTSQADVLGNGMRLSALLACPGLRRAGGWRDETALLEQEDMAVEPFLPGAGITGDLIRLTHKDARYFMVAEEEMSSDFERRVADLCGRESAARARLDETEVRDEIRRAEGLLTSALKLELAETEQALAVLAWGVSTRRTSVPSAVIRELLVAIQPGHLAALYGNPGLDRERERVVRAERVRARMGSRTKGRTRRGT
jgi:protein arginine kinase